MRKQKPPLDDELIHSSEPFPHTNYFFDDQNVSKKDQSHLTFLAMYFCNKLFYSSPFLTNRYAD